jgi:hypothetical protein
MNVQDTRLVAVRPSKVVTNSDTPFVGKSRVLALVLLGSLFMKSVAIAQPSPAGFTEVLDKVIAAGLTWTGGTGPFLLQKKLAVDGPWINVISISNSSIILAKEAQSGFFRVQSATTNTVMAFTALLSPSNERPAVTNSTASGIGAFSLEGSNLNYYVTFSGLTGPATAGHFHAPATPTNNASVLIGIGPPAATSGVLSGNLTLTPEQITNFVNGLVYVNIHTLTNGGGEIRGQVVPLRMLVPMDGASEETPTGSSGTANGVLTFIGNNVFYDIPYSGLQSNATAAHIHGPADTTNSAGVLVGFTPPSGTEGTISGMLTLTPEQLAFVLAGKTYLNIHTLAHQGGEIRGQVWPLRLGATMNGASEVPSIPTSGVGSGVLTVISNVVTYSISFTNLSSNAGAAHIHGPADTAHGGDVLIPFSGVPAATAGTFSGSFTPTPLQLFYIISGQTYINIHTINNGGGEIRGQIYPAQ